MMNYKKSLSLKLSLGILLLTVPIFVSSLGILFTQSRHHVKREAMERATSALNTTVQRVSGFLNTIETATEANDWLVTEHLHPDSLLALSRIIVLLNGNVSGCSITTEPDMFPQYGRYFSAYSVSQGDTVVTVREKEYEYFEKDWYKVPRQLGHACWIDPLDDYTEGTLSATDIIASYCKPIYDSDERFIGVISTDMSFQLLNTIIESDHPYPHSYFVMTGSNGHIFIHPDSTRLFQQTIFSNADTKSHADIIALGHEMTAGHQGNIHVEVNGQSYLACYQPVPGTSWSLAVVCPDRDILYNYHRLAYALIPLLVVGLVLILFFCRSAVTRAISPLSHLLSQTQLIAAGHYDQQIEQSARTDAVGRLQNSFAAMQQSLDHHVRAIKEVHDKTARSNAELARATELAREAEQQKTAFIQNVTHQIRTPLNIIMGFSQILRDSVQSLPDEEVSSITGMIDRNTVTLTRMVHMLYDSSDTGSSKPLTLDDNVSCNEVCRECIADACRQFPDNGHPMFNTTLADTYCIHTNHLYLFRLLRELLYNAAKYSDGHHVTLSATETDSAVRFTVEDTGPGISPKYRDLLFVPFTKTNDLSEGLGLGLPLTLRHVRNLGGDMTLDSDYHDGCRFIIELPKTP